jgi:phosphohistidine phosphatase
MKSLLLLRHAKSGHDDPALSDHDRPLAPRGKRDAPRVGERLLAARLVPDAILSSTAKRARKTAKKVAKACGFDGQVRLVSSLYLAPPAAYLEALSGLGSDVHRPLIVGHNPGMADLLLQLTGQEHPFPTAALAQLDLTIEEWSELLPHASAKLVDLWLPREDDENAA